MITFQCDVFLHRGITKKNNSILHTYFLICKVAKIKTLEQKEGIKTALPLLHNNGNYSNAQIALFDIRAYFFTFYC